MSFMDDEQPKKKRIKPPGSGRKKGTPNKYGSDLRNAILHAFERVGGRLYLTKVATEDPKTFCQLLAKVLPTQLTGADDGPIQHEDVSTLTSEEKAQRLARLIGLSRQGDMAGFGSEGFGKPEMAGFGSERQSGMAGFGVHTQTVAAETSADEDNANTIN